MGKIPGRVFVNPGEHCLCWPLQADQIGRLFEKKDGSIFWLLFHIKRSTDFDQKSQN
jgi:hypothetical protein